MIDQLLQEAQDKLDKAIMYYRGEAVGTIAALEASLDLPAQNDRASFLREPVNYDQCFIRDFVSAALVFLMQGRRDIVRNFLQVTLGLQLDRKPFVVSQDGDLELFEEVRRVCEHHYACANLESVFEEGLEPGEGLMPASFKAIKLEGGIETIEQDFGQRAIGRVVPIDSGLWWIFLLHTYENACDLSGNPEEKLAHKPAFQRGIELILRLCLTKRFDMAPLLLVPEASFMIDRRLGVYGYPLEIQVLFYAALEIGRKLLVPEVTTELDLEGRAWKLARYIQEHYWLDRIKLMQIFEYRTEEFGERTRVRNTFNIDPKTVPDWVSEWLMSSGKERAGYLVGNVSVGWMDFRFFSQGNLLAILANLVSDERAQEILNLLEQQWRTLIGHMPVKICYPAVEDRDWEIVTGCDPKNTPWSYHNGGHWPVILWILTAAACKMERLRMAESAIQKAESSLQTDAWPEYYDGKRGRSLGKRAKFDQTWTISGYLAAKLLVRDRERSLQTLSSASDFVRTLISI